MVTRPAVAALAASALLAGCSHTSTTAAPPAETATPAVDAGWVTADRVPAPAAATAAPPWQDGRLHPSSRIASGGLGCTAGWILPGADGVPVMLTAGHCQPPKADRVSSPLGPGDVGVWESSWATPPAGIGDVAAVRLTLVDPAKVDGGQIAGVMPAAEVDKLPPHTQACVWLPNSGTVCGEISDGGGNVAMLQTDGPSTIADGDSGSPVWTLDRDGNVVAIGVISTTATEDLTRVAYIEPAVRAYKLKLPRN
jgi:hypothetical protein